MDLEQARGVLTAWANAQFGKLLEVREINVVRRVSGRIWAGDLYCTTRDGDIKVGTAGVDQNGDIIESFGIDEIVDVLTSARIAQMEAAAREAQGEAQDDFSDFSMDDDDFSGLGDQDDLDGVFDTLDPSSVQERADQLIATGERDKMLEARELLPQLLGRPEGRGRVLRQMGELELLLGELDLGVNYLEASAREFADVADVEALEHIGGLVMNVVGGEAFETSTVKYLLDKARARMRPIEKLEQAPLFIGLEEEALFHLHGMSGKISVGKGEDLLREGEPAVRAFVVRSGVLSIRIETADGGSQVVRSCFPGDFIGESSVLAEPGATCTATVRGESQTELWMFEGATLRDLVSQFPDVGVRIESARTLHQLDSFLSTHEATAALDVAVRDQLLSCINGIAKAQMGEVLEEAGDVPRAVYLVAEGRLEYRVEGRPSRSYSVDMFAALRDTLHELPLEGRYVAATNCLLIRFDPDRLKAIAADAPPEVVAVLEKLE